MPDLLDDGENEWGAVIGRALSFMCLHVADLRDKELAVQAAFLQGLGLTRREAAKMLGTSEDSLRVLQYLAKRVKGSKAKGGKSSGKKKKKRS